MNIIQGTTPTAPKLMIYGLSGVGKSTLASQLKNPIFVDIEGGINFLDTPRTPTIISLDEFYEVLIDLGRNREKYKDYDTIVIDSADWLVRLATEKAAGTTMQNLEATLNRAGGGYGNGKQMLENEIRTHLLPLLTRLVMKGYGICLIAHADQKKVMDGDGNSLETVVPKIDINTMNVFVEWCDFVYYLKKKDDGERTVLLESDSVALAKNRIGLHGEVSLRDNNINDLLVFKGEK